MANMMQIVMYLNNYIDRNALPYARVQGIEEDLKLTGIVSYLSTALLPNAVVDLGRSNTM